MSSVRFEENRCADWYASPVHLSASDMVGSQAAGCARPIGMLSPPWGCLVSASVSCTGGAQPTHGNECSDGGYPPPFYSAEAAAPKAHRVHGTELSPRYWHRRRGVHLLLTRGSERTGLQPRDRPEFSAVGRAGRLACGGMRISGGTESSDCKLLCRACRYFSCCVPGRQCLRPAPQPEFVAGRSRSAH